MFSFYFFSKRLCTVMLGISKMKRFNITQSYLFNLYVREHRAGSEVVRLTGSVSWPDVVQGD